mgnify:FL=1
MARVNLYNYRAQENYYKKLRIYSLLVVGVVIALLVNVMIYGYLQIKIMYQQTRNSFLITHINILDNQLKPIRDFNQRRQQISNKINLIKDIDAQRDDMVAFFQQVDKITPKRIYFTALTYQQAQVDFNGVAAGPLYIADLLDKLRESQGIFQMPVLKSNSTGDGNTYNFVISASVKPFLVAETESNGISK